MIPVAQLITDVATALFLAAVPLYILDLRRRSRKGQDVNFGQLVAAFLMVGWLIVIYGSFIENRLLVNRHYQVTIGSGDSVMQLAVVADIHLGLHKGQGWAEKVVSRVNAIKPDLVLLVGDFVSVDAGLEDLSPFSELKSRYGSYAVLGNWDYRVGAVDVRKRIESYSVEVLTNESVVVGEEGREIHLIGLDDFIYGDPDWDAALADVPTEATTIVLGHEPDFAPVAEVNGVDLVISGHTHGGQIRLPLLGALPPLPIGLPQDFDRGLFAFGQTKLFISPGVGESGARARFLQPPEISILDIVY